MAELNNKNIFEDTEIISSYSRSQAIEDGILIDISELAKQAGFKFPVAVTCGLWSEVLEPDKTSKAIGQDITGRIWDTLIILRLAIRHTDNTDLIYFNPLYVFNGKKPIARKLKAVCSPGDDLEPVITIMLPNED